MGKTNKSNPIEDFNDGREYQVSKISSFSKRFVGAGSRNMEPGANTFYTTTRVSQSGVTPTGEIIYKREIYSFDTAKEAKNFKEKVENKDQKVENSLKKSNKSLKGIIHIHFLLQSGAR